MLAEALTHWLLPCPRPLKRLGVLYDVLALRARASRCRSAWAPHLAQARQAVLDLAPARGETAVVLGSGLLLDVPLEDLAARFTRVILADLWHLPMVRRRATRLPGVACREHDLTGLLADLPASLGADALPPPPATAPSWMAEADVVISANCLSQLPLLPLRAAEASGRFTPDARNAWARAIIEAHLTTMAACAGPVVMVCDTRAVRQRRDGQAVDWWDLLHGATPPVLQAERSWWWDIAPAPELFRAEDLRHRVIAGQFAPHNGMDTARDCGAARQSAQ